MAAKPDSHVKVRKNSHINVATAVLLYEPKVFPKSCRFFEFFPKKIVSLQRKKIFKMRYGKHSNIAAKPFFSGIVLFLAAFATVTAQSVFIPSCKHITCDYHTFVNRALDCDYSTAFFVCIPSFSREYALSLSRSKDKLVYMRAEYNIWYNVDYKKRDAKVKTRRYELPISKEQSAVFQMLAKAAVQTANNFHESDGVDGTTYMLSYINDEVETWSPRKNSRTGRTVRAMDSLCYAVEHSDTTVLLRQMDTCRVLIDEFKHLYPLSYFYPEPWLIINYNDGGVSYSPIDNFPDSTFVPDPEDYPNSKDWLYMLDSPYLRVLISHNLADKVLKDEKYLDFDVLNDSIAVWARELFLSYSNYSDYKINSGSYRIELYDTTATRCEITKDGYLIKMTASLKSLNRNMIISASTLNEGHYMLSPSGTWTPVRREDYPLWPDFRW